MITRVELINFMSHERTVIEPATGLTVLVGPNNCGKSAVVAALQILCNNADSTYVTRHGAKECSVSVETDDGQRIEWRRKTTPSYRINGEKFDRLGRNNVPEQLLKALRLPRVEVGDDNLFDVHFGEQKSPIFLLDRPASHAAKFFASSSDIDRFLRMQDLHRAKAADANREKQRLELESVNLNRELELLEPVVELDKQLEQSEKDYRQLQILIQSIGQLTGEFAELRRQTVAVERCAARQALLAGLHSPPALEATEPVAALIGEIGRVHEHLTCTHQQTEALDSLVPPPHLFATDLLSTLVEDLLHAQQEFAQTQALSVALGLLREPPQLKDADSLARLRRELANAVRLVEQCDRDSALLAGVHAPPQLDDDWALETTLGNLILASRQSGHVAQVAAFLSEVSSPPSVDDLASAFDLLWSLEAAEARVARCRSSLELLAAVDAIPEQDNPGELAEMVSRFTRYVDEVRRCAQSAADAERNFAQAKDELISWSRQNGICPTCGGQMDAERLVAHLSCEGDAAHA